jgi:hypothetical protein
MTTVPDGISTSKLRIAILMLNSPSILEYAHFATMNNYMYAARNGYDFIVERQPQNVTDSWSWDPNNEYVLVWYKPEFIKRHLKNYHYVLFVDSDAYFVDHKLKIEDLLLKWTNEKCMIFQEDVWRSDFPPHAEVKKGKICAGLIFVKNCPQSFRILDTWKNAPHIDPDCEKYKYQHAREQDTIIILKDKYPEFDKQICVLSAKEGIFGQYNSRWIVHLGGIPNDIRTNMITKEFDKNYRTYVEESVHKIKNHGKI